MGHHHNPNQPFSIPQIRFIPEKAKPWLLILFIIVFNCTGGVYLAAVSDMVGSTQLLQEDIMMAGYASLVGMALFFAIMFRLKWAVRPKTALGSCISVLIVANLICMHTSSVPLLVGVCLVSGFFRMWAIYECNSTIQLWITPKRDMSIWFCYIYLMVNGTIQLTGIAALSLSVWASWHYMYWLIIGALLMMYLIVIICYKGISIMPRLPLLGIDWVGLLLWGATALSILFVCVYGEHYDWWQSEHIWFATILAVVTFGMNWWRSTYLRHPYIGFNIFKFPLVLTCVAVILVMDLLLAPSHIFEHALMENILGYDSTHIASLNWISFAGVIFATLIAWKIFGQWKWRYRTMFLIAFGCFSFYLVYFYLMIDYHLPKEYLFLPIFVRSFGYVILAISLLTATTKLPFPFEFFQGITIQNTFSAALASSIGTAIIGHLLKITLLKNSMLISANFDHLNTHISQTPMEMMYGIIQQQSLIVSMKEIYGWLLILSFVFLFFILIREEGLSEPVKLKFPNLSKWRKKMLSKLQQKLAHG